MAFKSTGSRLITGHFLLTLLLTKGTGKTLTAEAVAEEIRRPLYSVSADELGSNAYGVETALTEAFERAARWQAVLLLDEADVFLGARTSADMAHNSVVAVFLRKLEYFQGLVFLTTNRHTAFDDAFRSRIHVHLRYADLSRAARLAVWKRFLVTADETSQTGVEVDEAEIEELASRNLNGREIRNIVKTALLLAWNAKEPLKRRHLDLVWQIEHQRTVMDGGDSNSGGLANGDSGSELVSEGK